MSLFDPLEIHGIKFPNRIVLPPIVVFWADESAEVTDRHVAHYRRRAAGGVGMIVVEATCVLADGRLSDRQLGIWSDDFIPGLARIAGVCADAEVPTLVQLLHGGLRTHKSVTDDPVAPSAIVDGERKARELRPGEIETIRDAYIDAALRAKAAGFIGVELHGAHGYLLNQFASPRVNKRTDAYGGGVESRLRLAAEIIEGIRNAAGNDFIISYRMGCNDPDLGGSIEIAQELQRRGIDMLHVSAGLGDSATETEPGVPAEFPHNWIAYGGVKIAENVDVPVIAVNGIRTPGQAKNILSHGVDFVAMARALLVDPDWPQKARRGETPVTCLECKPRCHWFESGESCPRFDPDWK